MLKTKFTLLLLLLTLNYSFSQSENVEVKKLKINNKLDHFAARVINGKVYFSYNQVTRSGRALKDSRLNNLYGIYVATVSEDGEIRDAKPIVKTKFGKFNMSAITFSKDGKYMYFTTNQTKRGKNKATGFETYNLSIQRAEYVEGEGWTNFTTLPFCDVDYNFAHPALSPDDSTLYFVADAEGTKGKSDLFKVSVSGHSTYGEIERLNDTINSTRTETFPFVSKDNKLYFTSNRRGGKGGLDIYSYDLNSSDEGQKPVSLDEPINSKGDDFSFFLNDDLTTGYLSSRRLRGRGGDDLYYFTNF